MGEPWHVEPDGSADPSARRRRPPPRRPAPTNDSAPPATYPLLTLQQLAGIRAVAQLVARGATPGLFRTRSAVQRQGETPPATPAGGTPPAAGSAAPAPAGLIVEDDVTGLRPSSRPAAPSGPGPVGGYAKSERGRRSARGQGPGRPAEHRRPLLRAVCGPARGDAYARGCRAAARPSRRA